METVQVTEKTFEATVKEGIVLLDFWASWCGPCRAFALGDQERKTAAPLAARAGGV